MTSDERNAERAAVDVAERALGLESGHTPSSDPFWQESWYFNFADERAGVFGLSRIGYRPSTRKAEGVLLAFVDGRPEVLYAASGRPLDSPKVILESPRLLETKGLSYRCVRPLGAWTIRALTSRMDVSLRFEAETPAHVFPALQTKTAMAASDHYEQAGSVRGRLRIGGIDRVIDGRGQRDHSWGPRDWSGVGEWIWLSAQFESGWCMNWWSIGKDGTLTGFVGHRDRTVEVVGGSVTWQGDPEGIRPTGAHVFLELADGTSKVVQMNIRASWPFLKEGATVVEFACTYECEGEKGVGISEHLFRERRPLRRHIPEMPRLLWTMVRSGR